MKADDIPVPPSSAGILGKSLLVVLGTTFGLHTCDGRECGSRSCSGAGIITTGTLGRWILRRLVLPYRDNLKPGHEQHQNQTGSNAHKRNYGTTTVSPVCSRMFCSGFWPLITSL